MTACIFLVCTYLSLYCSHTVAYSLLSARWKANHIQKKECRRIFNFRRNLARVFLLVSNIYHQLALSKQRTSLSFLNAPMRSQLFLWLWYPLAVFPLTTQWSCDQSNETNQTHNKTTDENPNKSFPAILHLNCVSTDPQKTCPRVARFKVNYTEFNYVLFIEKWHLH